MKKTEKTQKQKTTDKNKTLSKYKLLRSDPVKVKWNDETLSGNILIRCYIAKMTTTCKHTKVKLLKTYTDILAKPGTEDHNLKEITNVVLTLTT